MVMPAFPHARWRSALPIALVILALIFSTVSSIASRGLAFASEAANVASDGPGALSHFDLARKDCLGTARNTTSKVWFTLANGVLSDVYYPTIDNTNVQSLQYIVTDGRTFTDLQTRDTTYTVELRDGATMVCRVTTTAKSGKYRIVTDYLTDPNRNTVVMHTHFIPLVGDLSSYKLYLRYDPSINGNGGGGSGNGGGDTGIGDSSPGHDIPVDYDTRTTSQASNRDYAVPVYSALDASQPFTQVSNGFVGAASDGLTQLDAGHALTNTYAEADNGNLEQTMQVDFSHGPQFTFALGFGTSQSDAVQAAETTLGSNLAQIITNYEQGWLTYDAHLALSQTTLQTFHKSMSAIQAQDLVQEYFLSANVIKASEDKTYPGAIVAGLASPWGQAVSAGDPNNTFFSSSPAVFPPHLYTPLTALL